MKYKLIRIEIIELEDGSALKLATLQPNADGEMIMFVPPLVVGAGELPAGAELGDEFDFVLQETDEWILP